MLLTEKRIGLWGSTCMFFPRNICRSFHASPRFERISARTSEARARTLCVVAYRGVFHLFCAASSVEADLDSDRRTALVRTTEDAFDGSERKNSRRRLRSHTSSDKYRKAQALRAFRHRFARRHTESRWLVPRQCGARGHVRARRAHRSGWRGGGSGCVTRTVCVPGVRIV